MRLSSRRFKMPLYEVAILGHHQDGHEELLLKPTCVVAPNKETAGVLASTRLPKTELQAQASLEVLVRKFCGVNGLYDSLHQYANEVPSVGCTR